MIIVKFFENNRLFILTFIFLQKNFTKILLNFTKYF